MVVCGAAAVGAHLLAWLDRLMGRCWTAGARCQRAQCPEVLAAARSAADLGRGGGLVIVYHPGNAGSWACTKTKAD